MWIRALIFLAGLSLVAGDSHTPFVENDLRTCLRNTSSCFPTRQQINTFKNKLTGSVLSATDREYEGATLMYNREVQKRPGLVVMVKNVQDIREAILFARQFKLRVTIRSSGHDYVGRSTFAGSLNINLDHMKEVTANLDSNRSTYGELKVESAARWIDIYTEVDKLNRTIVGGSAHTVAAGGYTLGGGHSPMSRTFGYAVDNLLETQVVLADGSIATCTPSNTVIEHVNGSTSTSSDGDLFWALQGGGGGTFGVTTYFVFKLHPPSPMVIISGGIALKVEIYGIDNSKRIMNAVNNLVKTLPNSYGGYYLYNNGKTLIETVQPPIYITGSLGFFFNKRGVWEESDNLLWKELFDLCKETLSPYEVRNMTSFLEYEKEAIDPPSTRTYLISTMLQPSSVSESLSNFLYNEFFNVWVGPLGQEYVACTGILLGGKTSEPADDATPLSPGYRSAISNLVCGVAIIPPEKISEYPPGSNEFLYNKAKEFGKRMRQLGTGMYFNEPMSDNPFWREDFWGSNYERLLSIKVRYDPENFFTCKNCVGYTGDKLTETDAGHVVGPCVVLMLLAVVGSILLNL